ncbi:MAG TPA: hypothetical protein VMR25_24845 [Planctomycetaceae bacterium]|jgi:hypothetical protein|nr:hypothetical protein [Planctomycetaceae bacterium]
MTPDRLSQAEQMEATRKAQNIQKTINSAVGRRLVRCVGPLKIRQREAFSPDQTPRFGIELRVEPLVTNTDCQEQPARRIAATLREWAALLDRAAASLK